MTDEIKHNWKKICQLSYLFKISHFVYFNLDVVFSLYEQVNILFFQYTKSLYRSFFFKTSNQITFHNLITRESNNREVYIPHKQSLRAKEKRRSLKALKKVVYCIRPYESLSPTLHQTQIHTVMISGSLSWPNVTEQTDTPFLLFPIFFVSLLHLGPVITPYHHSA